MSTTDQTDTDSPIIPIQNRKRLKDAYDSSESDIIIRAPGGLAKQIGEEDGRIVVDIVVSTDNIDRDRDSIDQNGWQLDAYRDCPVVPWNHLRDYPFPVATAETTEVVNGQLTQRWLFCPRDVDGGFGHMIGRMYQVRLLHAASVGFDPSEWTFDEERGGFDFVEQELVESSSVTVPSNRESTVVEEARNLGVDTSPMARAMSKVMDENPGQRGETEKVWKAARGDAPINITITGTPQKEGQTLNADNRKRCGIAIGALGDTLSDAGVDPHAALDEHMGASFGDDDKSDGAEEAKQSEPEDTETKQLDESIDLIEALQKVTTNFDAVLADAETLADELENEDTIAIVENLVEWASGVQTDTESWMGSVEAIAAGLEDEDGDETEENSGESASENADESDDSTEQNSAQADTKTESEPTDFDAFDVSNQNGQDGYDKDVTPNDRETDKDVTHGGADEPGTVIRVSS